MAIFIYMSATERPTINVIITVSIHSMQNMEALWCVGKSGPPAFLFATSNIVGVVLFYKGLNAFPYLSSSATLILS